MQFYFVENNKRPRGRPIITFPVTLNNDPKHVPGEKITLTSQKDLDFILDIAENRDEWMTFIADIRRKTAEAVRSDDPTSEQLKAKGVLRISWKEHKTNEEVQQPADVTERLLDQLVKRKLRFAGHVISGSTEHFLQLTLEGGIEGRRGKRKS
ncbi:RNA-directed DNA polymerase from mobile element jockey [Elysia marginata]|uniref:RNA-directed DNA polymerase from mobile element jockey n=1 Tax=Elysia marginata TaxID=1093978 RepID=A0AAV4FZV8_9GAST|nr:RNA-directed DNA polymerase from mobile element jockey [Elysia marginata]